jgi:outer membrane protein TolC
MLSLVSACPALLHAQAPDSLRLGVLQREAEVADPRQRQYALLSTQSGLRLKDLSAERLPAISAHGHMQYQSETFQPRPVNGVNVFPTVPKDSYDGRLEVEQPIIDPSISPRRDVEKATLAQSEAGVRTEVYALREEVNQAFFSGALLAEEHRIIASTIADLEQRLEDTRVSVVEGAALPSDSQAIQAEILLRQQDQAGVEAQQKAALTKLAELVQHPLPDSAQFALPDLNQPEARARQGIDSLRARPEYQQFDRSRELLQRQADAISADLRPQLSAFGQAGYGRPGLNPISHDLHGYWLGGLEVKWAPWNWGTTGRQREALAYQSQIVATEEAAFTQRLVREIQDHLAEIERLTTAQALDDQIVTLREGVAMETGIRFHEGMVTASEYVDRSTELLQARLSRASHRVEQAQARAQLITTLGMEIP